MERAAPNEVPPVLLLLRGSRGAPGDKPLGLRIMAAAEGDRPLGLRITTAPEGECPPSEGWGARLSEMRSDGRLVTVAGAVVNAAAACCADMITAAVAAAAAMPALPASPATMVPASSRCILGGGVGRAAPALAAGLPPVERRPWIWGRACAVGLVVSCGGCGRALLMVAPAAAAAPRRDCGGGLVGFRASMLDLRGLCDADRMELEVARPSVVSDPTDCDGVR